MLYFQTESVLGTKTTHGIKQRFCYNMSNSVAHKQTIDRDRNSIARVQVGDLPGERRSSK